MLAATSSHACVLRLEITTLAPALAIASAIALPIPREDPVMSATLSLRENMDSVLPDSNFGDPASLGHE
jgi:hypothetical protein